MGHKSFIKRLVGVVLTVTGVNYYHSNRDVREADLLAINLTNTFAD